MQVILPHDYDATRDGSALFYFGDDPCFPCHPVGTHWNGFDNVRVSPQVRDAIAADWRDRLGNFDNTPDEIEQLNAIAPDADGLIDLSNGYATEMERCSPATFGIEAALTVSPEQAQWLASCLGVGCEDEEAPEDSYDLAQRLIALLQGKTGTLIRVDRTEDPLVVRLRAAGFNEVITPRGPALRTDGKIAYAQFTNRKGTGLPSADDWALEIWRDGHEEDADTDIQCDDDGADINQALTVALERLYQLNEEVA